MNRTTVLLLFGGESSEHDVSLSSARNIYAAIDNSEYDVLFGYIDRRGKWWLLDAFDDSGDTTGAPQLVPVLGARSFMTVPDNKLLRPDIIFAVLHGKNGEDGSVQGLAQLLHIPIVGCDMTSSSLGMDKLACKEIMQTHAISIAPYRVHRTKDERLDYNHLQDELSPVLFVKPSRAGSSVGVSKVTNQTELDTAIELAHQHDNTVLIESAIEGREVEVAVLGNPPTHRASGVGEVLTHDGFYSYDEKYSDESASSVVIPAELDETVAQQTSQLAHRIYEILGCSGLARVDFFITKQNDIYFNEINTLPGFTNISMYPKLWRQEGVRYSDLIRELIQLAMEN